MIDPRIIAISLDAASIPARGGDAEADRDAAIGDMLAENHFAPSKLYPAGYGGPYEIVLRIVETRLAIDIHAASGPLLETIMLALSRFRRPVRDYFAICDSLAQARHGGRPAEIEPIDMARRGLHNDGAALLRDCLAHKVEMDFATARRLFTLVCALHSR
jgi:uncharacterized protein (UPF0262 family)